MTVQPHLLKKDTSSGGRDLDLVTTFREAHLSRT